jgi:hypothetical protein
MRQGRSIKITEVATGNTATAPIYDACPTCGYGDLDLSTPLFFAIHSGNEANFFAATWEFV